MKEALLLICVLGIFVFGFFQMARLDKFLNENRKSIEKENEKKESDCVMLTEELSDEEIIKEVRRFHRKHGVTKIMLCEWRDTETSDTMEDVNQ